MVTRWVQAERRTGLVRRPKTRKIGVPPTVPRSIQYKMNSTICTSKHLTLAKILKIYVIFFSILVFVVVVVVVVYT